MQINDTNQLAQCHSHIISPSRLNILSRKTVTALYTTCKYQALMLYIKSLFLPGNNSQMLKLSSKNVKRH